jgi:hypothetical protein
METVRTSEPARRFSAHPAWHLIGAALVMAWLGAMLSMFWPGVLDGDVITLDGRSMEGSIEVGETWMGAYQNDRKLGYVRSVVAPLGEGLSIEQESNLSVTLAGLTQPVVTTMHIDLNADHSLEEFRFELAAGPIRLLAEGRWVEGGISLELDLAGERGKRVLPMAEPPVFDLTLPYLLAHRQLESGQRFRVELFDPQSLSNRVSLVEVIGAEAVNSEGRLVPGMHLRRESAGVVLDSWIDARGRVLKEQVQGGLTLVRESAVQAKAGVIGLSAEQASKTGWLRALLPAAGTEP